MADRYWVAGGTGNYNSTTNWSATSGGASGATVPGAGDSVFFNASSGAGTATINVASNCSNLTLTGFTGTLAFTNNLTVNGLTLNLGTGTYTVTGAGYLVFATVNNTFSITSGGTIWAGNIRIGTLQPTINFVDNFSITGTLELISGGTTTFNGSTIFIGGNLTIPNTGVGNFFAGTTAIVFNGTGTWSHAGAVQIRNNTTINTAGTLTIGTNIYIGNAGSITYTAGTVVTTGSTLNLQGTVTINTNGITWNNITTTATAAITLSSNLTLTGTLTITNGTTSFVLGGNSLISANANLTMGTSSTFTMPANQTFKTLSTTVLGGTVNINANTLTITENLVINAALAGSTNIVYGGTGTWTASGTSSQINNNFTINTAGTLTISGIVYKQTGTFTYTAGTIIDTGATVQIGWAGNTSINTSGVTWNKLLVHNTTTLLSNINAVTFGTAGFTGNTSFVLGGNTINFTHLELGAALTTTLPSAWTCQDLTVTVGSGAVLNGFSITVNGNILQSGNGTCSGTTTFTYAGTGSWTQTGTVYLSNSFTINTAGTLTFISANIGGGIFTYTAGTVVTTGSTLYIRTTSTTMNHSSIVWNNVVLGNSAGSGSVTSIILNNKLTCLGTLTFGISNTTFGGTDGTFDTYGLVLGIDTSNRTTTLVSTKTYRVRQSLTCTQSADISRVLLRSTSAGSQAIFTLDPGSTIDLGFVNATDINSSLGRPIYSYRGVFSNTLNWALLPTDNSRAGRSTFVG